MKSFLGFLKTTALGGLFVVFPLLLTWLLVGEILQVLIGLATPIADLFPEGMFGEMNMPVLLALLLLFGASFLFGLLMKSRTLLRLGRKIDSGVMNRLPAYRAIKSLSRGLLSTGDKSIFYPAILTLSENAKEIVYVTEDIGGEWVTVLQPWAPASFAGSLRIVRRTDIEPIKATVLDASAAFANFGVGALAFVEQQDD